MRRKDVNDTIHTQLCCAQHTPSCVVHNTHPAVLSYISKGSGKNRNSVREKNIEIMLAKDGGTVPCSNSTKRCWSLQCLFFFGFNNNFLLKKKIFHEVKCW